MTQFFEQWGAVILEGLGQTLIMVVIGLGISIIVGIPLGVLLVLTRPGGLNSSHALYSVSNWLINILRSLPFIIMLFLILPVTKFIMGTTIGVRGVLLPLIVYTAPYLARLVETSLLEVDGGVIEAYQSMGISNFNIIKTVLLREARGGIIRGLTIAMIGLIGATAMAGLVGAGGLGSIAYQYGFLRNEPAVMYGTILLLIILVQIVQSIGNFIAKSLDRS
ncbi:MULTISPECIES: methionine ABC transporter permease [Enterococcus]|uniref:D-methionine transport system permease n=1 Tax=Candidatus Enterococcus ferrettii TaxID=2815324 RepID=A0ABV0ES66_9ENTE|nr:methionine ABC transporter permease [Enterococcus sp. 665A]MBO1340554.1 ABC transporter permease [Enterococcus sp. 665A]